MKTTVSKLLILFGIISVFIFSCDTTVSLGKSLDLDGPVVIFTSPVARKAVSTQFTIEGTASDHSGIEQLLLKTESNSIEYPKQWRFYKGSWEVSQNHGANWQPLPGAEWNGSTQDASWKIPIDMDVDGAATEDGEYMFILQAWDKGGVSDENSYKTRVLIIDRNPPKVDISNPYLYRGAAGADLWETSPLKEIHDIVDSGNERFDPAMIGKFLTRSFLMQWQIEDNEDVWSIDIRFYKYNENNIDDDPHTALPDSYIYRYHQNLPPPPDDFDPSDIIKPNGSIIVPDLTSVAGSYDGAELSNPISEKTTVRVVAVCYDAAGNPNQEKTLGYFVYWPLADEPWIAFTDGMEKPEYYDSMNKAVLDEEAFMIYPGRKVKASAYHAHGLKEVVYSLYKYDEVTWTIASDPIDIYDNKEIKNTPRSNGSYSTIFTWEFTPPSLSGYYVIKAKSYSLSDDNGVSKESDEYSALFRVQDITFPNFPVEPGPPAGEPLFKFMDANTITIEGEVNDATEIAYLCMVWINPKSRNYAAMSQLQYFRDPDYAGWKEAKKLTEGNSTIEVADLVLYPDDNYPYDASNPNRLWRIPVTHKGSDPDTGRQVYEYSITVNLTDDLNIAMNDQPLASQVFQLRAENPDGKCTIITYAPQGDTLAPVLNITNVQITGGVKDINCIPNQYTLIPQFATNDEIRINGTWSEDSTGYLPVESYLMGNFNITVNGYPLPVSTLSFTPSTGKAVSGSWTATAVVDTSIPASYLKDTLVISANIRDIGGNYTEAGCSWLIESDHLRLMRISSENPDQTYKTGDTVEIFLEFNKPVQLTNDGTPQLLLNSTGTGTTAKAVHKAGQTNQSSRQYFTYTVGANHSTGAEPNCLNVTGLDTVISWSAGDYPFTWHRGSGEEKEEIRVTMDSAHVGELLAGGYYARSLPVTTTPAEHDYQFTLFAGKHIVIDTAPPVVTGIRSNTAPGDYSTGAEIYIIVEFDKPVKVGGTTPKLELQVTNGAATTAYTDTSSVRANGNEITFVYKVIAGDTTSGNPIEINTYTGSITDLAGNILAASGISSFGSRTLTGRYIDTIKPGVPTVRVLSASNTANVVVNNVNGTNVTGASAGSAIDLANVYHEKLWLAIQGNIAAGAHKLSVLEYSINNGTSWVKAGNTANTPFELLQPGAYNIIARQTDKAGNISDATQPVNFTWDPGNLVTRISSATPNGIYTHVSGRNIIDITVSFRKAVYVDSTSPALELNAMRSGSNMSISPASIPGGAVNSLTFRYTILNNDEVPGSALLDVLSISNLTLWDGNAVGNGVKLTGHSLPSETDNRLNGNKEFKIETGDLTNTAPSFIADAQGGTGWNVETDSNFHGIRKDDGSYWTTLEIVFNHDISKSSGDITVTQNSTNYRLPTVLNETQYNRFRAIADFDTYYKKGTNGYIDGVGADTAAKYILQYNYNPDSAVTSNDSAFTGDAFIPATFFTAFRTAEQIIIPVDAQAVSIDGNKLKVRLSGSNAPQVPGATYTVTYPSGLVQDDLGNVSSAGSYTAVTLPGVAKPFVRIRKTQDTIEVHDTPSSAQPRLLATQPFLAYARMDTRTPGAAITYTASTYSGGASAGGYTNTTGYTTANNSNNWSTGAGPTAGSRPTIVRPANATATTYSGQITLGTDTGGNEYQGYRWWVRAIALVAGVNSLEAEESAYRTVITYQLRNGNNPILSTDADNQTVLNLEEVVNPGPTATNVLNNDGDQIWIRGGNAIGSSSIPGFPFTWEDKWDQLDGRRAGIRLMTLTAYTTNVNNSIWKFVTWDINATAYVDFIRGIDTLTDDSSADVAWQYGPKRWAYQRAGWTSFKYQYPIYPGEHRWCDAGYDNGGKGALNFSSTVYIRSDYDDTSGWDTPNVANPVLAAP